MTDDKIKLTLDGQSISVAKGATLLEAAKASQASTCRSFVITRRPRPTAYAASAWSMSMAGAFCSRPVWPSARRIPVWRHATNGSSAAGAPSWKCLNASVNLEQAPEIQDMMANYTVDDERFPDAQRRRNRNDRRQSFLRARLRTVRLMLALRTSLRRRRAVHLRAHAEKPWARYLGGDSF